tara:strand:- start:1061 stop:1300 length:240 start_codon:yes stop_codon:yes gene_type:complete
MRIYFDWLNISDQPITGVKESAMQNYLETLKHKHRRLNRLIDNCKAAGRQHEMQQLKRIRLRIKDRIAAIQRRSDIVCT